MDEKLIKASSNDELEIGLTKLLENERKTTRLILFYLIEIEARRIYAKRGYDSLLRMLIDHFKLSESSAYRRIQAMRLLKEVPEAQEGIVTGELNLTILSMAQTQIKKEERMTGQKVKSEWKIEIIERIKNKTQVAAEIELFKLLPKTASQPKTEHRRISEDFVRLGLNFPDRLTNKLNRLREVWSHVDPSMDIVEIIERCADNVLDRVDPERKQVTCKTESKITKNEAFRPVKHGATGAAAKRAKYFPVKIKKMVYENAGYCCQYVDIKTGTRCQSKFLLQIDHITAIWAGGSNEPDNLQLLCATHNRLKYAVESGSDFVRDRNNEYLIASTKRSIFSDQKRWTNLPPSDSWTFIPPQNRTSSKKSQSNYFLFLLT